jgi:hypothetical protein
MTPPLPKDIKSASSYPVTIHIAGNFMAAQEVCQRYCDEVGLCVTVSATIYVYTKGKSAGVRIGLINYPRFPKVPREIWAHAVELGYRLRAELGQESFTVETPDQCHWFSWREEDQQVPA